MAQRHSPLFVRQDLVRNLRAIWTAEIQGEDARLMLGKLLQSALQLEIATIPPYLSAAFSIKPSQLQVIQLITRIAREEMLHLAVVANLMNAVGVSPDIVGTVPKYPYDLTLLEPPLRLDLRSFSPELVRDVFMHLETPEDPVEFPWRPAALLAMDRERPHTIGQFYRGIIELIRSDTIPNLFNNAGRDAYKQIKVIPNFSKPVAYASNADVNTYPLKADITFIIEDKETAIRHLEWIVGEGEGAAPFDPLTAEGLPGHYYRFESILKRRYLVKDATVPVLGYSFSGGDLPLGSADVYEFDANAKAENYAAYDRVLKSMNRFNQQYTEMIGNLQMAFIAAAQISVNKQRNPTRHQSASCAACRIWRPLSFMKLKPVASRQAYRSNICRKSNPKRDV
jgi:hypothetical protein